MASKAAAKSALLNEYESLKALESVVNLPIAEDISEHDGQVMLVQSLVDATKRVTDSHLQLVVDFIVKMALATGKDCFFSNIKYVSDHEKTNLYLKWEDAWGMG